MSNVQAVLSNEDLVGHLLAAMYDHKSMWNLRAAECFSGPEVVPEERRGLQTKGRIRMLARRAKRWCAVCRLHTAAGNSNRSGAWDTMTRGAFPLSTPLVPDNPKANFFALAHRACRYEGVPLFARYGFIKDYLDLDWILQRLGQNQAIGFSLGGRDAGELSQKLLWCFEQDKYTPGDLDGMLRVILGDLHDKDISTFANRAALQARFQENGHLLVRWVFSSKYYTLGPLNEGQNNTFMNQERARLNAVVVLLKRLNDSYHNRNNIVWSGRQGL